MLRSFSRHFNETVFRGPDTEGGGGDDGEILTGDGGDSGDTLGSSTDPDGSGEGGESDAPLTVREQIKKSIAEVAEDDANKAKGKKPRERQPKAAVTAPEQTPTVTAAPIVPPPASLPKEVAAHWEKTPPEIQQAFIKREQDMERGVNELKQRYNLIDQAIAPHNDALRQMNATPADAVNRMFLWFKALAGKPADAFPALAQSMGIDWSKLVGPQVQPGTQGTPAVQGNANTGAPEIPEPVRQYVGGLETQIAELKNTINQIGGRFGGIEQNINTQNQARTQENLNFWSKDKPYFNDVRLDMAKFIESGIIPLKDGQVDLDTAYERAIHFNPEVRAKVLAAQQQANNQVQQQSQAAATAAQQTQVSRARKASVSLPASTTPGALNGAFGAKKKPGERTSVRDSLKAALAQLRDQ